MSTRSEAVKRWRFNTKKRIIESLGGKCVCCGYDICQYSLVCHHMEDEKKDFGLGSIRAFPIAWKKIVEELRKCVLVCANHHGEIHSGLREVPKDATRFNEEFSDYKKMLKDEHQTPCPICQKLKSIRLITCSKECAAKRKNKINWDQYDLKEMKKTMSVVKISYEVGVSDVAVRKRMKKLGIT